MKGTTREATRKKSAADKCRGHVSCSKKPFAKKVNHRGVAGKTDGRITRDAEGLGRPWGGTTVILGLLKKNWRRRGGKTQGGEKKRAGMPVSHGPDDRERSFPQKNQTGGRITSHERQGREIKTFGR